MEFPSKRFYLFGMGEREKLLYRDGTLYRVADETVVRDWSVEEERIRPAAYRVDLRTPDGLVTISENDRGVRLSTPAGQRYLTRGRVHLPGFDGHPAAGLLRVLHQELLVNIVDGRPVPNLLGYSDAWYRDAAMVCMCLERTGNLHLVEEWIAGINEPFDRNNDGNREPDNLGQVLYLVSLAADESHPVVDAVLDAVSEFRTGDHIVGQTDFGERPVYQTKWLKFGLRSFGLPDPYEIPAVADEYSSLFWWDFTDSHTPTDRFDGGSRENYPYLTWAERNFHGEVPDLTLLGRGYPLTWEARASEAVYENMALIDDTYEDRQICAPHTWHAAEAFLHLFESSVGGPPTAGGT